MDKNNNNPYVGHKLAKHGPPSSSIVADEGLNGGKKKEKKRKKRGGEGEGEAMAALMGACKLARDLEDKLKGVATIAWDQDREEEEEEELVDLVALPPSTNNILYPQLVGASSRIVDAFNRAIHLLREISSGGTLSYNISIGSGWSSPQEGPEIDPAAEGPLRKREDRPSGGEEETPKIIKGKAIVKRGISSGASDSSCSSPGSSDHNIGQGSKSKDPPNSSAQQENVGGIDKIKKRKAMSRFTIRVPCNNMDMSSDTPSDDGFSWRKYGQKNILGSKYPRSYYKCTHKKNVECLALKQVQRLDEDPSSFMVTYRGEHSCRSTESNISIATIPSSLHHLALQQYCLNYNPFSGLTTTYQDLHPNSNLNPNLNLYSNSHINPNPNINPNFNINPNPIFDITSGNSGISLLVDPSSGSSSDLVSLLNNAKLDPHPQNFEFSLGNKPSVPESNENLNYANFIASQTCHPSLSLAPEASSCAMASTTQLAPLGVSGAWVQENPLSITSGGYDQIVQESSHHGRIFFTPTTSEEESSQTRVPRHESPRGNSDQAMNPSEVVSQHMTTVFSYEPSIFNTPDDLWGN